MATTLLDLLDGMAPAFQKAFLQAIADKKSDVQLAALINAITKGDTAAVGRLLALGPEYFMPLDTMLREAQLTGGGLVLEDVKRMARRAGVDAVARFNGRNYRAESFLRDQSSKLITRISDSTRTLTQTILHDGMVAGRGPRSVALDLVGRYDRQAGRRIGGVIGLTKGDVETSQRALEQLRSGDPKQLNAYLGRKQRNKTYDRMVHRALREGRPIPADTARKIVGRYQDKLLFKRGETIARTELLQSLHAAQNEGFQQLYDEGKLKPDQVTRALALRLRKSSIVAVACARKSTSSKGCNPVTEYTFATLDQWAAKSERVANAIVRQSAQDLFSQASRVAPGVVRGGSVLPGFVPRDSGFLAASAQFELNGAKKGDGENAYELGIVGMQAGDTAVLVWTAVYARRLHYDGWLWVDTAAADWQNIVRKVVLRARTQVK